MAYDHGHTLWLMTGDGKGGFHARTAVFRDWGSGYDAMLGIGDDTGDGRPDILERDTAGNVWVNPGEANGAFGGRVRAAEGWKGYLALY